MAASQFNEGSMTAEQMARLLPDPWDLVEIVVHGSAISSSSPRDVDVVWRTHGAHRHAVPLALGVAPEAGPVWHRPWPLRKAPKDVAKELGARLPAPGNAARIPSDYIELPPGVGEGLDERYLVPAGVYRPAEGPELRARVEAFVRAWIARERPKLTGLPLDLHVGDSVPALRLGAPFEIIKAPTVPTDADSPAGPGEWRLSDANPFAVRVVGTTSARLRRGEVLSGPVSLDLEPDEGGGYDGEGWSAFTRAVEHCPNMQEQPEHVRWLASASRAGWAPSRAFLAWARENSGGGRSIFSLNGLLLSGPHSHHPLPRMSLFDSRILNRAVAAFSGDPGFWRVVDDAAQTWAALEAGFEPVECCFGEDSVVGSLGLDHHGPRSDLPPVCRQVAAGRLELAAERPGVAVARHPDFDAVCGVALLLGFPVPDGVVDLVEVLDVVGPHGADLLEAPEGWRLLGARIGRPAPGDTPARAWGDALGAFVRSCLEERPNAATRARMLEEAQRRADARVRLAEARARGDVVEVGGLTLALLRAEWPGNQFDVWYRSEIDAAVVLTGEHRVTIAGRDASVAARFGPGGLRALAARLGPAWGGRPTVVGSPTGERMSEADARAAFDAAQKMLEPTHPEAVTARAPRALRGATRAPTAKG